MRTPKTLHSFYFIPHTSDLYHLCLGDVAARTRRVQVAGVAGIVPARVVSGAS